MHKMKLEVEALRVDSFRTEEVGDARGTVLARNFAGTSYPDPCRTGVSVCQKCFYTANPCECGSFTGTR